MRTGARQPATGGRGRDGYGDGSIAIKGRGFTPLASIVPDVIYNTNNGSGDAITNIFANGLRSSANNLTLDGVPIVDTGNNGTLLSLNLDSAGAQISAVTRGGTRDFHGSFYVFHRHDGMNANTWLNNRDSTPINSWDISLEKEIRIKERARIELRRDTFNTFNHTQYDGINSTRVEDGQLDGLRRGDVGAAPRNMQLSARLYSRRYGLRWGRVLPPHATFPPSRASFQSGSISPWQHPSQ